ncbi:MULTISPECIES: hypothetical protein [unclassified Bradyrhizobium]|uniref:hypothetical protein n=1 Tax=unclassified Bradyrhizobium TaxID=2631580 RepID=UPI001BA9F369|nr:MULTISPECIES: hypothetical protein [unclassified Bradyrhizobium]MBR1224188.1 hypothetical protein [Bradyrhizobium sp. AUGA SZCCT0176]MBR1238080.1 hypothetical protein [Bradyrhizobium sp. AUGA SZCCT0182]MBR1300253.1 hypothetical protein [Bradyrhizobium sp. AUGA SZCCT0042]
MKDYIELWKHNVTARWAQTVESGIEITGERNRRLGPLWECAKVTIYVEPSDHFEVVDLVESTSKAREEGYPDSFIFGLLDMLITLEHGPLIRIRVTLKTAEYDPINSTRNAYWQAGRDAGRKLAETVSRSRRHT